MLSAAWDWYYGSQDEELLADCEFGEPYSTKRCSNKDVCMRPARLSNGLQVTVFTRLKSKPKEITDLEKCSKRLKVLRHPNILRHIGIVTTETEVHLVTERVSPLYLQFETVDANEVSSGIYDLAQAVNFLHEKAGLTHNCIGLESIYVTEGGAWKLSNFESACPFAEATAPFLKDVRRLKDIIPPEESDNMVAFPIEKKYAHCRDVYALGILLGIFNKKARFASEVRSQELEDLLEEILQKDYQARPKVSELLDTAVLSSDYIEIVNFLQSITLKSKLDKKKFFTNFIPRLKKACISDELIAKRIAKLLLSPVVLAETEAADSIIPLLLTPIPLRPKVPSKGLISSAMFARYVIPQIVDLMDVKILHVRLVLVTNFHRYVHMFDKSVLQDSVLPEVLLGLHDSNNQLVKASLHALADSVPIVGGDLIVGTEREKIFGFGMPKFNGTVLVNTSSIASEVKQKRKPKKPKKKMPKRPATLLELAMSREKSPSKVTKAQRDLMMLKQNELALTLEEPKTNGSSSHVAKKFTPTIAQSPSKPSSKSGSESSRVISSPHVDIGAAESKRNGVPKQTKRHDQDVVRHKDVMEPEIETWAASGSEDEAWDDFDNFVAEKSASDATSLAESVNSDAINKLSWNTASSHQGRPTAATAAVSATSVQIEGGTQNIATLSADQQIKDLGTEFEIAVKLKSEPETKEADFFADMTPDIPVRKVPVLPPPQEMNRSKKNGVANEVVANTSPIALSFAAADAADHDGTDGWDDDIVAWDD